MSKISEFLFLFHYNEGNTIYLIVLLSELDEFKYNAGYTVDLNQLFLFLCALPPVPLLVELMGCKEAEKYP